MNRYAFVSSPYTHVDPKVESLRYVEACRFVAWCAKRGEHVYSPIVHWREPAWAFGLPTDHRFWILNNQAMMIPAASIYVLRLDGWQVSDGVREEIAFARERQIPLLQFEPIEGGDYLRIGARAGL